MARKPKKKPAAKKSARRAAKKPTASAAPVRQPRVVRDGSSRPDVDAMDAGLGLSMKADHSKTAAAAEDVISCVMGNLDILDMALSSDEAWPLNVRIEIYAVRSALGQIGRMLKPLSSRI